MKITKLKLLLVSALSIFLCLSCSKQEAPNINDSILNGRDDLSRVEACTLVNFNNDVLIHQNAIYLFQCTMWNKQFPALFDALLKVEAAHWNHIFAPLDKEFITNQERRNRFFSEIRYLDSQNGLDDLSRVINALNETNFFDSLNLMFSCIDNPYQNECKSRTGRVPTRDELKDVFNFLKIDPEAVSLSSSLIKKINTVLKLNEIKLRNEINKFKEDKSFVAARLVVLDALANKVKRGVTGPDRVFISNLLNTFEKSNEMPWLYNWLQDSKMNQLIFTKLLEYPHFINPIFGQEIKALKSFYDQGVVCTIRQNKAVNDLIDFDFKTYTGNYVEVIKDDSYKAFYDFSSTAIVGMKMANEICQELSVNEFNVNFSQTLEKLAKFLSEKKYYDLIKFALSVTPSTKDQNKNFSENQYLLDMVAGEIFDAINGVNGSVLNKTQEFYPEVFEIVKGLPADTYSDVAVLNNELLKPEHDKVLKGISAFWNFFSIQEKNFLFNFVDRHFDSDTNFTDLFSFYANLLNEYEGVAPYLRESYIGSEEKAEMTYLSVERLARHLEGREVLKEFNKFFSRDHILLILETLSNGSEIKDNAVAELRYRKSDEYLIKAKSQQYYFEIKNPSEDYDSKELLQCVALFNQSNKSFYFLIQSYPQECVSLSQNNISFKLFSWLTAIEETYSNKYKKESISFLDDQGILSPLQLNANLAILKELDLSMGDKKSKLPTTDGVLYLLDTAKTHLFEYNLNQLIPDLLKEINEISDLMGEQGIIYRNAVLKEYSSEKTFAKNFDFFSDLNSLLSKYGTWVKSGALTEYHNMRAPKLAYREDLSCEKVMNTFIYEHACPDKERVKKSLTTIFKYLTVTYESRTKSGIHQLVEGTRASGGMKIPLNGSNPKNYRLTLGETFEYLYDTTDLSLPINQLKGSYINNKWINKTFPMTTLERVEIVIRDVKFRNNYLGAGFLNGVVTSADYNGEVADRRDLMAKCLKIPKIRCMRTMTDDELRQAQNALRHFNSLLDVNNGRGLNKDFKYGNYLKSFEQTLVMSSAKESQVVQLFPMKDPELLKHNGRLLGEMTMINLWSNSARLIRDRLGRTREDFNKIIATDMKRIDDAFLRGFNSQETGDSAQRLLNKIIESKDSKPSILDRVIDWSVTLNYNESRIAEEVMGRMALMSTYLGSPKEVFYGAYDDVDGRYKSFDDNNFFQVFLTAEKLVTYFDKLTNAFPAEYRLYNALVPINNLLIFINHELKVSNNPETNLAYRVLNRSFDVLQFLLFADQQDPRFDRSQEKIVGMNLVYNYLEKTQSLKSSYYLVDKVKSYLDKWHLNAGDSFLELAQNTARILGNNKISFGHIRDYLGFTTKNKICLTSSNSCVDNKHFDEPAKLAKYLLHKGDNQRTYFETATQTVFVENFNQLNKMISEILPAIAVKSQKFSLERL